MPVSKLFLKGSLYTATGFKMISESSPSACPVELPSYDHSGYRSSLYISFSKKASVFIVLDLERKSPTLTCQIYSAIKLFIL